MIVQIREKTVLRAIFYMKLIWKQKGKEKSMQRKQVKAGRPQANILPNSAEQSGLQVSPIYVVGFAVAFVFVVFALHIWGKLTRS